MFSPASLAVAYHKFSMLRCRFVLVITTIAYRVAQKVSHYRIIIKSYLKLINDAIYFVWFWCKGSTRIL